MNFREKFGLLLFILFVGGWIMLPNNLKGACVFFISAAAMIFLYPKEEEK